jgi:hypothetical protein
LLIMGGFSMLLFAGWNLWMWQQGKRLQMLAHLLDQVDKHNEIIAAVHVMDELDTVTPSTIPRLDRTEVLEALLATRESLINALMTERIIRKHQRLISRRQALFTNIETNLVTLQNLQVDHPANEYGQLFNEALQIGLSIRRELEKLNSDA